MHPQRRGGGGGPPDGGKAAQEGRKVFIGNLSWDTKDADFTKYFEQFGPIEEAIVMRQKDGGSRGFGFVSYKDRETVDKVIAQQKLELDGRRIDAKRAIPKDGDGAAVDQSSDHHGAVESTKLFVGGLSATTKAEDLKEVFSKYGKILDSQVHYDKVSGNSRGFGFVVFEDSDSISAVLKKNEYIIHGKRIDCKRAIPQGAINHPSRTKGSITAAYKSTSSRQGHAPSYDNVDPYYGAYDSQGYASAYDPYSQAPVAPATEYARYDSASYQPAYDDGSYTDPYKYAPYSRDPYAPRDSDYTSSSYSREPAPQAYMGYSSNPSGPAPRSYGSQYASVAPSTSYSQVPPTSAYPPDASYSRGYQDPNYPPRPHRQSESSRHPSSSYGSHRHSDSTRDRGYRPY